jgi:hypothetical protein
MAGSMAYYHGPCKDDLEMATGGHRLEKKSQRFHVINKSLRNTISAESNNRYAFSAAHSQFSNHHNFIKNNFSIGPDFKCVDIVANRQAFRYTHLQSQSIKKNYRRVSYGHNILGNTTGRFLVHPRMGPASF